MSDQAKMPTLELIVIQCSDIEASKDFYATFGLSFVEEQHGKGPRHYSCVISSVVFELYPKKNDGTVGTMRIGFRIPDLDQTVEAIRSRGMRIQREVADSAWGRRAVVVDPDGNIVELSAIVQQD